LHLFAASAAMSSPAILRLGLPMRLGFPPYFPPYFLPYFPPYFLPYSPGVSSRVYPRGCTLAGVTLLLLGLGCKPKRAPGLGFSPTAWDTSETSAPVGWQTHRRARSTAQHSKAQHSTAQHSTAQHSTAQHSTAQHSTAQHSTAQHSTAQQSKSTEGAQVHV